MQERKRCPVTLGYWALLKKKKKKTEKGNLFYLFIIDTDISFSLFNYLFVFGLLGFRCFRRAFPCCRERGLLSVGVHGLLTVVGSLVAAHGP